MNSPLPASPNIPRAVTKTKSENEIQLASIYFTLVGIGYLFPFSALTQPVDYWHFLFPNFNIEFPLTTIYMYTNLIVLALLVFGNSSTSSRFTPRIVGGFIGQFMVLVFVPTSYFFITSEKWNVIAILSATAMAASVTAFLDSSVIALASQYPLRVQESFQLGVGISTLIGSVYRDITKGVFPEDAIVSSSLLYFYSGAATIAVCIGAYFRLMKLDLTRKCVEKNEHLAEISENSALLGYKDMPSKWSVLRKIWYNELMVTLVFASTLSLWPPLVTTIPSYNFPHLQSTGWWSLVLLTLFSVSDVIGRLLVKFRMGITPATIWRPIVARFLLFPLIFCSVTGFIFVHDAWSILFVSILGFTNGYIGTLSIILINDVITVQEQPIAGMFTSFFLNSGLVLGATIGLIFDNLK